MAANTKWSYWINKNKR